MLNKKGLLKNQNGDFLVQPITGFYLREACAYLKSYTTKN